MEAMPPDSDVVYEWRGEVDNAAVNRLHAEGFDRPLLDTRMGYRSGMVFRCNARPCRWASSRVDVRRRRAALGPFGPRRSLTGVPFGFATWDERHRRRDAEVWVRLAGGGDLAALAELGEAHSGVPGGWRKRFEADLSGDDRVLVVAGVEGSLAGYGRVRWFSPSPRTPAGTAPVGWYLGGLVVAPEWRGCGVGAALTRMRVEWVSERADEVWYYANARNVVSLALHAAVGFEEVTRVRLDRSGRSAIHRSAYVRSRTRPPAGSIHLPRTRSASDGREPDPGVGEGGEGGRRRPVDAIRSVVPRLPAARRQLAHPPEPRSTSYHRHPPGSALRRLPEANGSPRGATSGRARSGTHWARDRSSGQGTDGEMPFGLRLCWQSQVYRVRTST